MIGQVLEGLNILICRPQASANELAKVLSSVGAQARCLPCLEIKPCPLDAEAKTQLMNLDQYQAVIVTSQYAAEYALAHIDDYWPQMPVKQKWYAIGQKTAQVLSGHGLDLHSPSSDLCSEELLALPGLQKVKGNKVLILKGQKGRETLSQSLKNRSAKVDTLALYERKAPSYSDAELQQALQDFTADYVIALSGETLNNLVAYARQINFDISDRKFILSSQRVVDIAKDYKITSAFVPENLLPIAIIRCIAKARMD